MNSACPSPSTPRRSSSRFQVTRNYDTTYNPSPRSSKSDTSLGIDQISRKRINSNSESKIDKATESDNDSLSDVKLVTDPHYSDTKPNSDKIQSESSDNLTSDAKDESKYHDKSEEVTHNESVSQQGDDLVALSETKLVKTSTEISEKEKLDLKIEVTVKKETHSDGNSDNNSVNNDIPAKVSTDQMSVDRKTSIDDSKNIEQPLHRDVEALKQIEAITEDFDILIKEMRNMSIKTKSILTKKSDKDGIEVKTGSTQTDVVDLVVSIDDTNVPVSIIRENVVLKKNKSESSLDSPDLEVSRLTKKMNAFCDSSSSLEVSGSSMESLNPEVSLSHIVVSEDHGGQSELDRRKSDVKLSTESSLDTSELTPVNSGFLNTSVSSNESVSPIIFGRNKKLHGSLSSLEASVSSLESARGVNQEKVMVTSADSGIEYSLQNPSEKLDDNSSNEGTLTHNLSLKDSESQMEKKKVSSEFQNVQDTLTLSPKRTSSLLDVPALKTKGLDRVRKISWVPPSPSFHIPKPEPEPPKQESKLPIHLERFLSIFQHPGSLFSRSSSEEEKRNTPPRKESTSLSSSFWSWSAGTSSDKSEKEDSNSTSEERDSSPENATDSTLSMERVQVSFVDESFSKKLDSKTPSTETDNTLSEFQSLPIHCTSETSEFMDAEKGETEQKCSTDSTTTETNIVQTKLDLSLTDVASVASDHKCDIKKEDLIEKYDEPNEFSENKHDFKGAPDGDGKTGTHCDNITNTPQIPVESGSKLEQKLGEVVRPRSFASVLKSTPENSMDKQTTPDNGQSIDKLPIKIIRGIKENISPENTLTSSMTNTKALAQELVETKNVLPEKNDQIVNSLWEISRTTSGNDNSNVSEFRDLFSNKNTALEAEICNVNVTDSKFDEKNEIKIEKKEQNDSSEFQENIDLGKDALAYLVYENQDFEPDSGNAAPETEDGGMEKVTVLSDELRDAELKEQFIDLSPELVMDEATGIPKMYTVKEAKGLKTSPVIPERAKLKRSNSLEELSQRLQRIDVDEDTDENAKSKLKIVFDVPEIAGSKPKDIPERRQRLRTRSGSSPKSLPEGLFKPSPIAKFDGHKKKKKVSSLGKIARDSLLSLNMSDEELAEFRKSYKLTSVESLRSLESVSEDANSQSNSIDSRCRICLRTSQESLMSLDSISEDCKCGNREFCGETSHSTR